MEWAFESVAELAARLRAGSLDPIELVQALLDRIAVLDGRLHAFLSLTPERALAEARAAREAFREGRDSGPLQGIPYAVKDLFDVAGTATTAGTRLRQGHRAAADCAAVAGLAAQGMSILGKTHTVQFALGAVGINHDQGTPLNPWSSIPLAPGGSSSGSGVAVAAGLVPVALGTDTGGSVRIPAALCGTVGLKTTVGRVSRAGVYPLSGTLDSVGVFARRVEDAALVFQALQGRDRRDVSTLAMEAPAYTLEDLHQGVAGLRIAICETVFFDEVDAEVEQAVRASAEVFDRLGARVTSLAVPEIAEAAGEPLRPLLLVVEGCAVNAEYLDRDFDQLDPVIARRMLGGRQVNAPDYYALLQRRSALIERTTQRLQEVDALLAPTTQIPARPLAVIDRDFETYSDHNSRYNRNTGLGNFLDLCGVSLPCGLTGENLPIGLMIYARPFREDLALRTAYAFEQATEWHTRQPDLAWAATGGGSQRGVGAHPE